MTRHVRSWALAALAAFALAGAATPSFAEIIYNVTNYADGQNGWLVNGTITVSGLGTFTDASAITAWDITLSKSGTGSYQFTNALSGHDGITLDASLIASTGALGLSDNWGLRFGGNSYSMTWLPAYDTYQVFYNSGMAFELPFSPSNNGVWTIGTATPSAVPEIDPAMGGSALSLVAGVLAMIEQRRRRAMLVA